MIFSLYGIIICLVGQLCGTTKTVVLHALVKIVKPTKKSYVIKKPERSSRCSKKSVCLTKQLTRFLVAEFEGSNPLIPNPAIGKDPAPVPYSRPVSLSSISKLFSRLFLMLPSGNFSFQEVSLPKTFVQFLSIPFKLHVSVIALL